MLHHLIIQFLLYYLSSGCLWEVKNKNENVKLLALKVVAVAEERWSLRRVSRKWRFDCTLYPVSLNVKVSLNSTKVGLFLVSSQ